MHGRAVPIDVLDDENAGFRQTLLGVYVPPPVAALVRNAAAFVEAKP